MKKLTVDDLPNLARIAGVEINASELGEYMRLLQLQMSTLAEFDAIPPLPIQNVGAKRDPGYRPNKKEDPLNAIIRRCSVKANLEGPLSGMRVGLKDLISIAGVPMTLGSRVLDGYVPMQDAVIVERLLQAGAEIVATLNMENFAFHGGGETSHFGYIRNPIDPSRTASGSSSGSAAALYYEDIDVTFGTDQGGSIRLPASWCGVLGLKPTYGLVPYTGIASLDRTFDHVGPLARTVKSLAMVLDVVAGRDPSDPRQPQAVPPPHAAEAVRDAPDDFSKLKIGILEEGFVAATEKDPLGTRETMDAVLNALDQFSQAGAKVTRVSIPEHNLGQIMFFVALAEGAAVTMRSFGDGYHFRGRYSPDFATAMGKGLAAFGAELPPSVKLIRLLGTYMSQNYFGALYGKAQNYAQSIVEAYDRALANVDVLAMPTATHYAHKHAPEATLFEHVTRGWTMLANSPATNISGHPALNLPVTVADGLPVGLQLVTTHFNDAKLLAVARTWEKIHGWPYSEKQMRLGKE
jgi:amidase